jgi:hypothetical protein
MAYTTIDDPSAYFHTQLYTGNGASSHSITNNANAGNFKPDWLWIKQRSQSSRSHSQWDTSRGNSERLQSDNSFAEETQAGDQKTFDTNGFTVGGGNITNESSQTFVAWQWKANGGTTSSNTDGSITSTVQANTTAGFSIVTYTGTGSSATVGHGLGSVPKMLIVKERDNSNDWKVYHHSIGNNKTVRLDTTDAQTSDSTTFASTTPTSSVFSVNSNATNRSGGGIVAYCFAPKKGYSKFDSYIGNGSSTDGTFIYLGFKPAFFITKNITDAGDNWILWDNKRDTFNLTDNGLAPNSSTAEFTDCHIDFVSNGIKIRNSTGRHNGTGDTHIYMAFAESPFVSSLGVPTTAR